MRAPRKHPNLPIQIALILLACLAFAAPWALSAKSAAKMDAGRGLVGIAASPNNLPTADAGPDQTVESEETGVTLNGTESSDPDGDPLTYSWTQVYGPPLSLIGADDPVAGFDAPVGPETLEFELTVDDGQASDTDTVVVTVRGDNRVEGSVSATKTQSTGQRFPYNRKKVVVVVHVRAREPLTARAKGKVELGKKSYRLKPETERCPCFPLKLRPSKQDQRRIAKALLKGRTATARLKVKLTDKAGNKKTTKLKVKLKR